MVSIGDTLGNMGYTDGTIVPIDGVERCITGRDMIMSDWVGKLLYIYLQLTIFLFLQIKQQLGFPVDLSYVNEGCVTVGYGFLGDYSDVNAPEYKRYHRLMEIFAK